MSRPTEYEQLIRDATKEFKEWVRTQRRDALALRAEMKKRRKPRA